MIVLDTDVLSELLRPTPSGTVVAWLDAIPSTEVATTAMTAAELLCGVARLPAGRRKEALVAAVHALLVEELRGRVVAFDTRSAEHYAVIVSDRERLGRPISVVDAQIAAVCRTHQATLATRNTRDFEQTGIERVDPWRDADPRSGPPAVPV